MRVLFIAYYEFLKNLRDLKMLFILVIIPIITTFILGTAIEGYFLSDSSKRISIGYVNKDTGITGKEFDKFLEHEEISKRLKVKKYSDKAKGEKSLEEGTIDVLVYLPEDLSQSLLTEKRNSIKLYGNKNVEFVESLIGSFMRSYNAVNALISVGGMPVGENTQESNISRIFYTETTIAPRAIDYYAVLILLQTLIVGAIFGVFITVKNYGSDIHIRVHSIPISKWTLISGRIIGSVVYLVCAAIITMLGTKILFNVNWNGNLLIILLTILVFCSIVVGMGVLIGLFVPSYSTALMLVMVIMIFFGSFSGSVSPENANDAINFLIPNHYAKILVFGTIYGYSKMVMQEAAFRLLGIMFFIYCIVGIAIRRHRYDNI